MIIKLRELWWRIRLARALMRKAGFEWSEAWEHARDGDVDFDTTPDEAADDELYYMAGGR